MTSNSIKSIDKSIIEQHKNRTDQHPSSEISVKVNHYPSGYPENQSKEQCNKKEEKHKDCHPMHCHHMQPMQSATNTLLINMPENHSEQSSKK